MKRQLAGYVLVGPRTRSGRARLCARQQHFQRRQIPSVLPLQGFYYVTLDCVSGVCEGFYFDSFSQPFQKLVLKATPVSSHGFSSSAFQYN